MSPTSATPPSPAAPLRIVGVADTDSYVKWAASLLGGLGGAAEAELLVLETPVVVSRAQERAAVARSGLTRVSRVAFDALESTLAALRPDVVLVAARGPLVRVVARLVAGLSPRPVIVSGLPGISIPATRKALVYRTQCDLFVLHSHREVREFAELARERGHDQRFALARLPFAQARAGSRPQPPSSGTDLVFAAQAIVPRERSDRLRVARLLIDTAKADPSRRVVLKVRATAGEHQTHREVDPLDGLIASLGPVPPNLVTSAVPMSVALDSAEGLVTVSSTAAIEAVARGIPVIALDTFGVSPELINEVFRGSDLLAGEADVMARRLRHPSPSWLRENYFHESDDDDLPYFLAELVARRRAGRLPAKPPLARVGGTLRDAWERKLVLGPHDRTPSGFAAFAIGMPLRAVVRAAGRVRRLVRRADPLTA
ncbi:DUF6716 putative glycosyltransferase [Microbacterium sp. SS28]|uniref:DUF6716 putative glycosyltransferase n=1 Tax=Microbacterium sp. SS28 TaxID=2919948 RepID=UPI001FA98BF1|nr:DUF6716 putative glycosyltransferase [Microbacterium sp. SS28]